MRDLWRCIILGQHIWEVKYSPGWIPKTYYKCARCGRIKKGTSNYIKKLKRRKQKQGELDE